MAQTLNSTQTNGFWRKLNTSSTIHLSFGNRITPDSAAKSTESQEPTTSSNKHMGLDKESEQVRLLEHRIESGQESSEHKSNEDKAEKSRSQELRPSNQKDHSKIDLTVGIQGKIFEDPYNGCVWKSKWYLPPIVAKLKPKQTDDQTEIADTQKLLQKFYLELYATEPIKHKEENKFQVAPGSILGTSKKRIQNSRCEFKNIKIHSDVEGSKFQLLLVAYFVNEEIPSLREYLQVYVSPEITIYNQSKFIQLENSDQFGVFFQLFDHLELDKPLPKIRTDKGQTPHKLLESYLFKKFSKIKNVFYLALKFPEAVELYANTKYYYVNGHLRKNFCQDISQSVNLPEQSEALSMVCNYIHPEAKLVMKINCSPKDINFVVNKSFTHQISIVVGEDEIVPSAFTKVTDMQGLKRNYTEYCRKMQNQLEEQDQQDSEAEEEEEEQVDDYDEQNSYSQNDEKIAKKKSNKKKSQKRDAVSRQIQAAGTRNTRSRKKKDSGDEESQYTKSHILIDDDEEERTAKKTRSSVAIDRQRKELALKEKIDQKNKLHQSVLNKSTNSQMAFPPFMMPIGTFDRFQLMNYPGVPYQMTGCPQMMAKNGIPQPMLAPQMVQVLTDNKRSGNPSTSDSDNNKQPTQPQNVPMIVGMAPYGMPMMMANQMMAKGMMHCQTPPQLGLGNGMYSTHIPMMPAHLNSVGQQSTQNRPFKDKPQDSRSSDMKRSMQVVCPQIPIYQMLDNSMMAVMPPKGQSVSNLAAPQTGVTLMMNDSFPVQLPQNGPFLILSGQSTSPTMSSKSSDVSSNPSFKDKKTDQFSLVQQKRDDKKVPMPHHTSHQQMADLTSIQPQQILQQLPFPMGNPTNLQQTLQNYQHLSSLMNPGLAQTVSQMQKNGQLPSEMKMNVMMNPFANQPQFNNQGINPALQQYMGFTTGPMNSMNFGPQPPYSVVGMIINPTNNRQSTSNNKDPSHKQDEESHNNNDRKMQQPGIPEIHSGNFYTSMPQIPQTSSQMQMAMQQMPMMASNGSFVFPTSAMPKPDQQMNSNANWSKDQYFSHMQRLAAMGGMPGAQGMPGVQMMGIGQMGMPTQYMGGLATSVQMMQDRKFQHQGHGQQANQYNKKRKEEKK